MTEAIEKMVDSDGDYERAMSHMVERMRNSTLRTESGIDWTREDLYDR